MVDKIEKHYAGPYQYGERNYHINFINDNEDDDCNFDENDVEYNPRGRPFTVQYVDAFDLFECVYVGGYSFHRPIKFHTTKLPDNENYIKITEDQFVAERKTGLKNIRQSRLILEEYLKNGITTTNNLTGINSGY